MTQSELKRKLYEFTKAYFKTAEVVWGKAKSVSPGNPLVILQMGSAVRPYQPIKQAIDGVPVSSYPTRTTMQIDVYTKGAPLVSGDGVSGAYENTAVNDLIQFLNFVNSPYADDWTTANDISILANQVQDLTGLINDTTWNYRAMAELEIGFTQSAVGFTGINYEDGTSYDENGNPLPPGQFNPTPSGGGSQELADENTGWFEEVEEPESEFKEV